MPPRATRSLFAIRASVWASTALVGSTSTRSSAFERSARARTSLWRCPPENERPRSSIVVSSPSGSASITSSAFAIATAEWIASSSSGPAPGIEALAKRAREEHRVRLADDDPPAHRLHRQFCKPHVAEDGAVVLAEPSEPIGDRAALPRAARRRCTSAGRARSTSPDCASVSGTSAGGSATGLSGSRISRSTRSTFSIFLAPTCDRVILSTASAAVRNGMTRKAAYP